MSRPPILAVLLIALADAAPARAACFVSMDCGGGYGHREQSFTSETSCRSALSQARSANGCDNVRYDCTCSGGDSGSGGGAAAPGLYDPNASFGQNFGAAATGVAVEKFSTEFGKFMFGDPGAKARREQESAEKAAEKAERERLEAEAAQERRRQDALRFENEKAALLGEMKGVPQGAPEPRPMEASGGLALKDLSVPITEKIDCKRQPLKPAKFYLDAGSLDDPLWVRYLRRKQAWCRTCDPPRSTQFCAPDPDEPSTGAISNESRHPREQPGEVDRDGTELKDITSGSAYGSDVK